MSPPSPVTNNTTIFIKTSSSWTRLEVNRLSVVPRHAREYVNSNISALRHFLDIEVKSHGQRTGDDSCSGSSWAKEINPTQLVQKIYRMIFLYITTTFFSGLIFLLLYTILYCCCYIFFVLTESKHFLLSNDLSCLYAPGKILLVQ